MSEHRPAVGIAVAACGVLILVLSVPTVWIDLRDVDLTAAEALEAEASVRSAILQLLGGFLLAAGLVFTARTLRLTREGHITGRYSSAIEQLGHASTDVRLGGIFALERVAIDSPGDRDTVVEVLSAYVRSHTTYAPRKPKEDRIDVDVQAALTVLGRRPGVSEEVRGLDLTHCGLKGADLRGNFNRANFHYSLIDDAIFTGGSFVEAGLSFTKGKAIGFNNVNAHGAHFVHARLTASWFIDSDLTDTDFFGCDLSDCDMGERYPDSGAPAPASRLDRARFERATLTNTNLGGSDLSTVRGLAEVDFLLAKTDERTIPPPFK